MHVFHTGRTGPVSGDVVRRRPVRPPRRGAPARPGARRVLRVAAMTDVTVIGFGPAGASAAIAAHDAGARVTVLERMPYGGGNALNSGGFLFDVDGPRAVDHLDALCFGKTPRDVLEVFADGLHEVPAWLESLGGATRAVDWPPSWPNFPGHVTYRQFVGDRPGPALFDCLRARGRGARDRGPLRHARHRAPGRQRRARRRRLRVRRGAARHVPAASAHRRRPSGQHRRRGPARAAGRRVAVAHERVLRLVRVPPSRPRRGVPARRPRPELHLRRRRRPPLRRRDRLGGARQAALPDHVPAAPAQPPAHARLADLRRAARLAGPLNGIVGTPNDYAWSADNSAELDAGWIRPVDRRSPRRSSSADARASTAASPTSSAARRRRSSRSSRRCTRSRCWPAVATASGGPRRDAQARVLRATARRSPACTPPARPARSGGTSPSTAAGSRDAIVFGRIAGTKLSSR